MWFLAAVTLILFPTVSLADNDFRWNIISDRSALCNDYTPAGYFVANGRTPEHWVIFLESGGGCYSPDTCNARYFNENVRTRFKDSSVGPLIKDDAYVSKANISIINEKTPLNAFVSPLVTSIATFQGTSYFRNGITVKGQGILDDDCTTNPVFCNHTRVIIPYCSSDLWLANSPSLSCNISKDLYDQCYANVSSCAAIGETFFKECFRNSSLSFVFRGQAIYRGAIEQLLNESIADISSVTLVGSSAGGVGVINHANWTLQFLRDWTDDANLSVIADSSWFVNFQDNVYKVFDGLAGSGPAQNGLFNIIAATDTSSVTCNDTSRGTPCCFSAFCMLSNPQYYPSKDVSTFMLFGLYDVYLLAQSLIGLEVSGVGQKNAGAGLAVKFIQTVSEYGGAMNNSLSVSSRGVERLSYYVTECFQHIYLVTSTLWGEGNLFGNQAVDLTSSFASFRHSMKPDIWHSMQVGTNKTTIRDALSRWYPNRYSSSVVTIRDNCTGPHCNSMCPEQFVLGGPSKDTWPTASKIVILTIVGAIGVLCVLVKVVFMLWLCCVERYQHLYLTKLLSTDLEKKLEFPECSVANTISVSCLDVCYSVTVKARKVKDEKKDETTPIVLGDLDEPAKDGGEEQTDFGGKSSKYKRLISETVDKQRRKSVPDIVTYFKQSSSMSLSPSEDIKKTTCFGAYTEKKILNGISIYFNPGQLTGIMGPSGCGKTTFLDILTGRRKTGTTKGQVYVNGLEIDQIRDWYIANTGYVLQLATPYYEELTVRENLTLAALIKLPSTFSMKEKLERIEQVIAVSELLSVSETVVGKVTGPGLSGGQKRRLAIALQLLKLPSVLFLDEPTSGLDATSSYELLTHLNKLADSKRTVILTIHQPRLEIFHLFNYLLLLTDGKIAYHGASERAYEVFVQALKINYKEKGFVIPQLEAHNPADLIMDMLGNPERRAILTEFFNKSDEPEAIRSAIKKNAAKSKVMLKKKLSRDRSHSIDFLSFAMFGAEKVVGKQGNAFTRLASLEARGGKRASLGQMLYLPAIFFAYGVLLGTVYYQSYNPLLVMSGFCVYSVASALFMFPALSLYYQRALEVYAYERADGVGSPWDIVIQGFIRGITLGFFPVIICAVMLYLLLVNAESYDIWVFGQVLLVNLALNQTWVALLIFVICAFPKVAFRLSPIISSVAGFTSGFFVPRQSMPPYYRWLFYINPNYYGFSASANLLLNSLQTGCDGSIFECFPSSSQYYLKYFNFDDVNPYLHITILLSFTTIYLLLAVFSNWFRYTTAFHKVKYLFFIIGLFKEDSNPTNDTADSTDTSRTSLKLKSIRIDRGDAGKGDVHYAGKGADVHSAGKGADVHSAGKGADVHSAGKGDITSAGKDVIHSAGKDDAVQVEDDDDIELVIQNKGVSFSDPKDNENKHGEEEELERKTPLVKRRSIFLKDGEHHKVHTPHPEVRDGWGEEDEEENEEGGAPQKPRQRKMPIWERQKTFYHRMQAAMDVMREADIAEELSANDGEEEEGLPADEAAKHSKSRGLWQQAAKKILTGRSVLAGLKQTVNGMQDFHNAVSALVSKADDPGMTERAVQRQATLHQISRQITKQLSQQHAPCLVPIARWKELVRRATLKADDPETKTEDGAAVQDHPPTHVMPPSFDKEVEAAMQHKINSLSSSQVVIQATIESRETPLHNEGTSSHSGELRPNSKGVPLSLGTHPCDDIQLYTPETSRRHGLLVKEAHVDEVTSAL